MNKITGLLILKLVQLGALDRDKWRPRLTAGPKKIKQYLGVTDDERSEIIEALDYINTETSFSLEKNHRLYANRLAGRRIFKK